MNDAKITYTYDSWTISVYGLPECEFVCSFCKDPDDGDPEYGKDIDHLNDYRPGDAEVVGGMIKIRHNGKYGFCSRYGDYAVPCVYDYAGQFEDGLCVVGISERFGIIDTAGSTIVPLEHESIYRHYETPNRAFELPGKYLLDVPERKLDVPCYPYVNGEKRCLLEVDYLSVYMPGVLWRNSSKLLIRSGSRYWVIDSDGNLLTPLAYEMIHYNGVAGRNGKSALLDAAGKEVLPPVFDHIQKIHPCNEIAGDMRGDFIITTQRQNRDRVFTNNGLFLCDAPSTRYTAQDIACHIISTCAHLRLNEQHFLVRAENKYGVIQKEGVCGHTIDGQQFIGFCELVPFVWSDPESCQMAYETMIETPCHEINMVHRQNSK